MKAAEQMRALRVNLSPPIARGSPVCDQAASEIFPCVMRAKQALIDTSNAVACGKTVFVGMTRLRYVIFPLPRQARSKRISTWGSSISVSKS
jgi:hypothetical protein